LTMARVFHANVTVAARDHQRRYDATGSRAGWA
jgi:hypothetical protein